MKKKTSLSPLHQPIPSTGFLRLPQVLRRIPIGRGAWRKGVIAGIYPQPIRLGPNMVAWRVDDVMALLRRIEAGELEAVRSTT